MSWDISSRGNFSRAITAALTTSDLLTRLRPDNISSRITLSIAFRFSSAREILTGLALLATVVLLGSSSVLTAKLAEPPLINDASSLADLQTRSQEIFGKT